MFYKLMLLICALLSILNLCGCKKGEPTKEVVKVFAPTWFLPEEDAGVAHSLSVFNREFPDARVEFIAAAGRWEQILQKLVLMCSGGQIPDVIWFRPEWIEVVIEKCVAPMDGADLSNYFSRLVESITHSGKVYGIPYEVGVRVVWLRSDILKATGVALPDKAWTVEDFLDVLLKLQNYGGKGSFRYAFAFPAADDVRSAYQALALVASFGGDLSDLKSEQTKRATEDIFKFYRTIVDRGFAPREIYQSTQGLVYSGLREKWYAAALGGSWELKGCKDVGLEVFPVLPPVVENSQTPATYADIWAVGLSPVGASKKSAQRLVDILTSKESQLARVENGLLSARRDVYSSQPHWLFFMEHAQTLRISEESLKFLESFAHAIHLVTKGDWTEEQAMEYVFGAASNK